MTGKIIRLQTEGDPTAGMQPSNFTDPHCFTTDDKTELNHTYFAKPDESLLVGVWLCAPCREEIESYPVHETMTVLGGSVTLTGADGQAQTFTTGDTFFVEKGTKCVWEITETLRKYYTIVE